MDRQKFPQLTSLSVAQLQFEIDKYERMRNALSRRLSDGGSKVESILTRLKATLEQKLDNPQSQPYHEPHGLKPIWDKLSSDYTEVPSDEAPIEEIIPSDELENIPQETPLDDLTQLTEKVSQLNVEAANTQPIEDMTQTPQLSLSEVNCIRLGLGLPPFSLPKLRWFTFYIHFDRDLAHLIVFDCASRERYLLRTGKRGIWFIRSTHASTASKEEPAASKSHSISRLTSPAEALKDVWNFIRDNPDNKTLFSEQDTLPCLLCRSPDTQQSSNQLTLFSCLLRNGRHDCASRSAMPSDCRFVDAKQITPFPNLESFESMNDVRSKLVFLCRAVTDAVLVRDASGQVGPRDFKQPADLLRAACTRSLFWMEAPLELDMLRQIQVTSSPRHTRDDNADDKEQSLHCVPDCVLRRLAASGLGRTRLSHLAGHYDWHGFAGLLTYRLGSPIREVSGKETRECDEYHRTRCALITDDLVVVRALYRFFRSVSRHVDRHHLLQKVTSEGDPCSINSKSATAHNPWRPRETHPSVRSWPSTFTTVGKVHAWTAAGGGDGLNSDGTRRTRLIDMNASVRLMQDAQEAYQAARVKHHLPIRPTLPPVSEKLGSYRDGPLRSIRLDFPDSETESDSDESTTSNLSDASSFRLEEID